MAAAGAGRGSVTLDGNEEPSSSLAHRREPQVTFRVAADLRANRLKEPLRWEAVTRAYLCFWPQPIPSSSGSGRVLGPLAVPGFIGLASAEIVGVFSHSRFVGGILPARSGRVPGWFPIGPSLRLALAAEVDPSQQHDECYGQNGAQYLKS